VNRSAAAVHQTSARARTPTKELLQNNSYIHDEQRDNPMQEKRVRQCPLQTVAVAETLINRSRLLATTCEQKQIDLAGHWLAQHKAPVMIKPDSMPRLEGAR